MWPALYLSVLYDLGFKPQVMMITEFQRTRLKNIKLINSYFNIDTFKTSVVKKNGNQEKIHEHKGTYYRPLFYHLARIKL